MIPSLPTSAQALWILVPRKYRLSATLAGSAYHVALAGGPAGAAWAPGVAAGGTMQRRRNVPGHSRPAAFLAAETRASTLLGWGVCADPSATPRITASAAAMQSAREFMLLLLHCGARRPSLGDNLGDDQAVNRTFRA